MGKGQELRASVNYSSYSKSVELGFTEPYLFDRNIALGGDLYRRDFSSFGFGLGGNRQTSYKQISTGLQLRTGVPITEFLSLAGRYGLSQDKVTLDLNNPIFFSDPDGDGPLPPECVAGIYLCDSLGSRITSSIGYSLAYDNTDNRIRPTRGNRFVLNQDFAGLGGSVRYLRTRANAAKYFRPTGSFVLALSAEAGYIHSFEDPRTPTSDPVRIIDRFFLGEPQIRGFDIRGVGPRVQRFVFAGNDAPDFTNRETLQRDDALGGRFIYNARAEVDIPLGSGLRELGLRPSVFVDAGAVFGLRDPLTTSLLQCAPPAGSGSNLVTVPVGQACPAGFNPAGGFVERYVGDSPKPRVSVGFGVNWNSPFGPFRIDIAKALTKVEGDDTKLITFNVGTAF
jgi:outer membrane protein insertion porin family